MAANNQLRTPELVHNNKINTTVKKEHARLDKF